VVEHGERRRDIEHGQARDALGVIERQPVRDAAAPVVARHREALVTELPHDGHLVARHRTLAVHLVPRVAGRLAAVTVAPQIGNDDGEAFGQARRDAMPHGVCLRVAVQKQHGRAAAAGEDVDRDAVAVQPVTREAGEHQRITGALGSREESALREWREPCRGIVTALTLLSLLTTVLLHRRRMRCSACRASTR
jgi:hypothetical protein